MVDREDTSDWTMSHKQLDGMQSEAPVDVTGMQESSCIERKKN